MFPDEEALDVLRVMLRIRRLGERLIRLTDENKALVRGDFYSVYFGQEAAGAAACAALRPDDHVFTTHRNQGHVIAKGGDPGRVLAEIFTRVDGYCEGRGGTFHVAAPNIGIPYTSAIVGSGLALAAGASYASKLQGSDRATVAFFGDGAMEAGISAEVLSIACMWKLPLIFFMENNALGSGEADGRGFHALSSHSASALADVPRALNLETEVVDGSDAETIYDLMSSMVARLRRGYGPFFVESRTTRWPGDGPTPRLVERDTDIAWTWEPENAPEVLRVWAERSDPILLHARKLLERKAFSGEVLLRMDAEVRAEIEQAATFALNSPPPEPTAALDYAYA